jgi:hypothetical protein
MNVTVLDSIPFRLDRADLFEAVRMKPGDDHAAELEQFAAEAEQVARPKGLYAIAYIESKGERSVVIEGVEFTSRVLRVNLDAAERVFPSVTTCGTELEEWSGAIRDPLAGFWADSIKRLALRAAGAAVARHLDEHVRPGPTSSMAPGSLEDWPLEQQGPLFRMLGDVEATIGVRLSDSFLMVPTKSVSSIRFPTEVRFESCQLCPRESCPSRRAPYDPGLFDERYAPRAASQGARKSENS